MSVSMSMPRVLPSLSAKRDVTQILLCLAFITGGSSDPSPRRAGASPLSHWRGEVR
jgi:hypothetical protein